MAQTNLDSWKVVEEQIERSKIKRYPYKKLLGVSLTKYIIGLEDDKNVTQIYAEILRLDKVKQFLKDNFKEEENFEKNLWISICARTSEKKTYRW